MSIKNSSIVSYDFKYGERYSYNVFSARDIELIAEERVGIYSWHMRLLAKGNRSDNIKSFCNIMASKSYDINLRSNLKDQFNGKAIKMPLTVNENYNSNALLSAVTTILCPPIYIGISNNIKSRLTAHKHALISFLDKKAAQTTIVKQDEEIQDWEDSEFESTKFAERVGKVLFDTGIVNESSLFIKVIYLDGISREELRQCESFANRNFHPLFGIR